MLSEIILEEQLRFFYCHQIHDAISLSQGSLHTIHMSKKSSFSLKVDLSKAYDRVS